MIESFYIKAAKINIDPIKKYLYLTKTFLNLFIFIVTFKGEFLPIIFLAEIFFIFLLYFLAKLKTDCDLPPTFIIPFWSFIFMIFLTKSS